MPGQSAQYFFPTLTHPASPIICEVFGCGGGWQVSRLTRLQSTLPYWEIHLNICCFLISSWTLRLSKHYKCIPGETTNLTFSWQVLGGCVVMIMISPVSPDLNWTSQTLLRQHWGLVSHRPHLSRIIRRQRSGNIISDLEVICIIKSLSCINF